MLSYQYENICGGDKIDDLMLERCNSIANALELRLSYINAWWSYDSVISTLVFLILLDIFILK